MRRALCRLLLPFAGLILVGTRVCAGEVTIDSASARAVLKAVQNSSLTREEAMTVAAMDGNQGLVRKAISYKLVVTTETLAEALLAAASGMPPPSPVAAAFNLDAVKSRAASLISLLDRIDSEPEAFKGWVVERVKRFSPQDANVDITGYLLAGGQSGGFAFGEPKFYLNVAYFSEFEEARVVMAHELYHAVQGVFATKKKPWWEDFESMTGARARRARQCFETSALLQSLYLEGTASYVGDPLLLKDAAGPESRKMFEEMNMGLKQLANSRTLLELSVAGLNAEPPVPYDDVYALGFYLPETLYKIGYAMSRAIAADMGPAKLAELLSQPVPAFVSSYLALPNYGRDDTHRPLGAHTIAAVRRLQSGCRR